MYFQLFPFAVINQASFHLLPVELIALIFRYLDDDSLLNVFSTSRRWAAICRGDPILRNRIRNHVREIQKERRRVVLNPSIGVEVIRTEPTMMFATNNISNKRVTVKRDILPRNVRLPKLNKEVSGGPIRSKTNGCSGKGYYTRRYELAQINKNVSGGPIKQPSIGVEVFRTEPTTIFATNNISNKQVTVKRDILPRDVHFSKLKKKFLVDQIGEERIWWTY
ncbi:hypothetical protein HHI36_010939 [Cryptolaemus montrouzieri]|uniref:F-box domain-containing protein n=1 Tax=Cryptolaemus montrouzieri TaxID=559131 RepID=A0ABD2MK84_9CUCU